MATPNPQQAQPNPQMGQQARPMQATPPQHTPASAAPQQQGAQPQPGGATQGGTAGSQQMASPTKEVPTAHYCRIGQELVQDTVSKTSEIFNILKMTQLPNGANATVQAVLERKTKLEENIRTVSLNMRKLKVVYDKVKEDTSPYEHQSVEALLPIEVNGEVQGPGSRLTEPLKYASEEHKAVVEQIQTKNRQLKEIIDQLRLVIWEINTMMAMRRV